MRSRRTFLKDAAAGAVLGASPAFARHVLAAAAEDDFAAVGPIVENEIALGHFPGAVVLIGTPGRVLYREAFGQRSILPEPAPMRPDTIFDIASLTKMVATLPAVLQQIEAGRLALADPVARHWPAFAAHDKGAITVLQLLTHMSGLRPDIPDHTRWHGEEGALIWIAADHPLHPPGTKFAYSDLNFIVLGALLERLSGQRLDVYSREHVFAPLGMAETEFLPSDTLRDRIAPTDIEGSGLRWGGVQDPIAAAMGGVAGHAGVFSTADDLSRFARMILAGGTLEGRRVLAPQSVARMTQLRVLPGGVQRGLGWDMSSEYSNGMDAAFGTGSFGHTGYTGTALWIDPVRQIWLILLTSRLHPRDGGDAVPLRHRVAPLVAASFGPVDVLTGIDVLQAEDFRPLEGVRLGLLTNNAGRDRKDARSIDVLAGAVDLRLASIFAPEHGLEADREGKIDSGHEAKTGLPLWSLYGATRRPTPQMLAGLDALVVDLQDVGVRYYTYASSMAYMLEAAAAHRLRVFVLDRPNPIGGAGPRGPVLDADLLSFTGYFPMPTQPAMTMGELALMFNAERGIGADLAVIPMRGYKRQSWYDQTGLPWIDPSPNLRSVTEEALYPAIGMIEGASISVGRGTSTPFELVGAPWIEGDPLLKALSARAIPGVTFDKVDFVPTSDSYKDQVCEGVRVTLSDRDVLDAPRLGVELACVLHRLYPDKFDLRSILGLVGSRATLADIAAGLDPRVVAQRWKPGLDAFATIRAKYLIY